MNPHLLKSQVKSLEVQLSVLKARLSEGEDPSFPRESFGRLYGILSGKADSTEEDIRAARYRDRWDESADRSE